MHGRVDLARLVCSRCRLHSKPHSNSSLVTHIARSTPGPRGLNILDSPCNPTIPRIHKQRDPDIDLLRHERIPLLAVRSRLELLLQMLYPIFHHMSGEARQALVEWEKLLEADGDDVGIGSAGEEGGDGERGRQPVDEILWETMHALEGGIIC